MQKEIILQNKDVLHIEPFHVHIRSKQTEKRKHAVQSGAVWASAVADYMMTMYPDLLNDEEEMLEIMRLIEGNLYL